MNFLSGFVVALLLFALVPVHAEGGSHPGSGRDCAVVVPAEES